jgi:hypothetical protein
MLMKKKNEEKKKKPSPSKISKYTLINYLYIFDIGGCKLKNEEK